jgi:hypothetical protein
MNSSSPMNLQHRAFLTPIWITAGAAAAAFLFALFMIWVWGTAGTTTVIVIPEDPGAGEDRSALLSRMFGSEQGPGRLDAIYASGPLHGRGVSALAERLHVTLHEAPDADAKSLARSALHRGNRVLVVARADLFPGVVEALSGVDYIPRLGAGDYSVAYVVTVPRIGHANLLRLNY